MRRLRITQMKFATHGLALMIGCAIALVLKDNFPKGKDSSGADATGGLRKQGKAGLVWLDDSLRAIREEAVRSNAAEATQAPEVFEEPMTIAGFLRDERIRADEDRKLAIEAVDEILADSEKYRDLSDFPAAIRGCKRDPFSDDLLPIFTAWLNKAPDAALAELARNWKLQESYRLSSLLERKYGRSWLEKQVKSDECPYRLRKAMAVEWGRWLGWDGGLEDFLGVCQSVSDPALKDLLVSAFAASWPRDSPENTGRILRDDASPEPQPLLLDRWSPMVNGCFGSFPMVEGMANEWLDQVKHSNPLYSAPERKIVDEPPPDKTGDDKPEDPEVIFKNSLPDVVSKAIDEGTDLAALFGENRISREEFLSELTRRIPGSERHPEELEREAWGRIAEKADPKRVASWAAELAAPEDIDGLLRAIPYSKHDPRHHWRLGLYRELAAASNGAELTQYLSSRAKESFQIWDGISPSVAAAWLDSLPTNDRLRMDLEKGRESP